MAIKKVLPLQASTRPETKNFVTAAAIAVGDAVALDSGGQLVKADRTVKTKSHVVGFAVKTTVGGTIVTVPVQIAGILSSPAWAFSHLGQPVFLDINGGVVQNTTGFPDTSYLVQVGVAIGSNQISVQPQPPRSLRAIQDEQLALASGAVFKQFIQKDQTKVLEEGKLTTITGGNTITTLDDVNLPTEGGTLLTTNSQLICVDYGGA
jgi:hypothetical protein